jgi:hypothetical protein
MIVEKQMECRLAGETEVLGENLPQRHFCPSQNPTRPDPGLNPGHGGHRDLSPQENYNRLSGRYLSAKLVPTFAGRGVAWSAQRIFMAVNLGFLDRSRYLFIQVDPQLSSRG